MRYYVLLILTWLFAGFFCPVRAAAQDGGIPIYYRWAKSSYDPAYLGNSASVEALVKMVNSVGLDSIAAINITAYASPEGVYECNMQLSRERMRETRWLMKSKLPEAYGKMHFKMAGEAWFFFTRACRTGYAHDGQVA